MAKQDVELQFKLIDGVSKGLAAIQQGVNGLGASLVKINAAAELTGKAFGAISSVAGAFGDAITGAASVEDALTRVNTITQATVEEQKALQDAVRGAVEGTRFSAEEAAGALVLLAEDGFSASEAVDQLGSVLQFAQANAQSAAAATGALGAVLDTFGEKPAVIGELADKLTAVAVGAGGSTKALQEGLAGVGVAAEQAGLSVDETIGFLGLLATKGKEGSAAAADLNKILRELSDPASKAGKEIKALGLDADDFAGAIKRLGTDSVAAEKVLSALGKKPREALRVLLQEGGGDLGKFRQILEDSAGASKAASDALNENFAGALERVQNQLALARNDFLTPLLEPLAAEVESFRDKLDRFTESRQFDRLRDQLTEFVSVGIKAFGDLIEKADFEVIAERISSFASSAGNAFADLAVVVKATAGAISGIASAIEKVQQAEAAFRSAIGGSNNQVDQFIARQKALQEQSKKVSDALNSVTGFAKRFGELIAGAGDAAKVAGGSIGGVGTAGNKAADGLDAAADAAAPAVNALGEAGQAARDTAIAFERMQVGVFLRAMDSLMVAGLQTSDSYKALNAKFLEAEARINALTKANQEAAASTGEVAAAADKASRAVSNYGSSAGNASGNADRVSSSAADATEALSNFEQQAKSVTFSLGNMSEAFAKQAQAAAGTAQSATEYVDIWNSYVESFENVDRSIERHIEILQRQTGALTEEQKIRRQLEAQYGTESTRLEELVALKLKLAEARRKDNDESEREIQIEERRTQLAGGIGTQSQAQSATTAGASAGRGAPAGASRGDSPISITINQNGATPETIREIAPLIERELGRLGALRR